MDEFLTPAEQAIEKKKVEKRICQSVKTDIVQVPY